MRVITTAKSLSSIDFPYRMDGSRELSNKSRPPVIAPNRTDEEIRHQGQP
jgi:hypothetical protein